MNYLKSCRLPSNGPEYSFIPARKNNSITNNNSMKKESKKSEVKPKSELCHCWPPIKQYIHKVELTLLT